MKDQIENSKLFRRIASYSAMALTICGTIKISEAQVIYSDIDPDLSFDADGDFYEIDLNSDGDAEAKLFIVDYPVTSMFSTTSGSAFDGAVKGIFLNPLNGAEIAAYAAGSFAYPYVISNSEIVNDDMVFLNNTLQSLNNYQVIYDYPTSGSIYVLASYGYWNGAVSKFIGLRFQADGNTHYGYIRLNVSDNHHAFTIIDYAYNATPEEGIMTGDQGVNVDHEIPASSIEIYSNLNSIYIHLHDIALLQSDVRIFSMNGILIEQTQIKNTNTILSLPEIPTGVYIVEFHSPSLQRFVKNIFIMN